MNEVPIDMKLDAARRAASVLYGYGARRVWAFGSLTKPRPPDRRSDVDLAVEGLPPHLQHQATRKASMLVGTRVDVLAMETTPAHLRWAIMRDRVMLLPSDTTPVNQGVAAVGFRPFPSLQQDRLEVAAAVLEDSGARSMIDFGCGHAWLIERLAQTDSFTRLLGIDFAMESLDAGMRRLRRRLPPLQLKKVALLVGLVTDRDPAFLDFDAGVAMEVIEHLAPEPRRAFEAVLFDYAHPDTVFVTTPNVEYNSRWQLSTANGLRHPGHRFEWTRAQFKLWTLDICGRFGYAARILGVGPENEALGAPTQACIFKRPDIPRNRRWLNVGL